MTTPTLVLELLIVGLTLVVLLKDDYHKKKTDMLAYIPVEYEYLETLAKSFIIPAKQNQIIQENIINKAPVRRTAIAMNTKSAFKESYTENLSDISILVSHKLEYSEKFSQL